MESIKEIFRIGKGPSSSHTMGPQRAAQIFLKRHPNAHRFEVTLYGSLAATGKGHMTDVAIQEVLREAAPVKIVWKPTEFLQFHPNGMKFVALNGYDKPTEEWTVYSVGGGALSEDKGKEDQCFRPEQVYNLHTTKDILGWCEGNGRGYWEYVALCEDKDIWDYLRQVWQVMQRAVHRGIDHEGALPGPLHLARKAPTYYTKSLAYKPSLQTPRPRLRLCPGRERGECLRRHGGHGPDVWSQWRGAGRAGPSGRIPQFLRDAHPPCPGYGRHLRQHRQV